MTLLDHAPGPAAASATHVVRALQPLVRAEARAEAPAAGLDPADLEQSVWVRLLERPAAGPPDDAARWVRDTVRAEARRGRRTARRERPY
ncbi:sigma-70 family RNA polymerase sigma factor, partial [Streptomyces californicus]